PINVLGPLQSVRCKTGIGTPAPGFKRAGPYKLIPRKRFVQVCHEFLVVPSNCLDSHVLQKAQRSFPSRQIEVTRCLRGIPAPRACGSFRILKNQRTKMIQAFDPLPVERAWPEACHQLALSPEESRTVGPQQPLVAGTRD